MTATANAQNLVAHISDNAVAEIGLQCPQCRRDVEPTGSISTNSSDGRGFRCPACLFHMVHQHGIWKALLPGRESYVECFISEYQAIRSAEGRGSKNSEYYLELPYRDLSGRNSAQWTVRAHTYRYIERKLLRALEANRRSGLKILDLGAGNGWLSYRLALRGHQAVAVDLLMNDEDGLGAARHFQSAVPAMFPRFQAELDCLPFAGRQFDVAIFNASFHYSQNYTRTLGEALRCLKPGGTVIIADTAWYRRDESGQRMLSERRQAFLASYGFASDSLPSLEYLTDERLHDLEKRFGLRWKVYSPFYGFRWAARPWAAKLKGQREPSQFRIYIAELGK
jgi:SAM-dependent methyltransferase